MKLNPRSLLLLCLLIGGLLLSACGEVALDNPGEANPTAEPAHDMRNMFPQVEPVYEKVEQDGTRIEFTVKAEDPFLGDT